MRKLTNIEIDTLKNQNCECSDWNSIYVADGFNPNYIKNVIFDGKIELGEFNNFITNYDGVRLHSGIFNCRISNVSVGNNSYINHIGQYIANCQIGDNCHIENVGIITCDGNNKAGEGTQVNVLNETGGRIITLYKDLSIQEAYLMAMFPQKTTFQEKLVNLIQANIEEKTVSIIGNNVKICNCKSLSNIYISDNCDINNATYIFNTSCFECCIYNDVVIKNAIISKDSKITDGANIENAFIGKHCEISKTASVYDSVVFENSQIAHSEVCAAFAGPFTVTHHRATLLIGGMYSFFNAGSGSNQSNHAYKLGPSHQGIFDRGTKFASNSYILLPASTGVFSMIKGDVSCHIDSREFPFSYIIGEGKTCWLIPGKNLFTIGTKRDTEKWPKRNHHYAQVDFELLNPYSIAQILNAQKISKELLARKESVVEYKNFKIKSRWLEEGLEYYQMAIDLYLKDILNKYNPLDGESKELKWMDWGGLIYPTEYVTRILNTDYSSITELKNDIQNRPNYELNWVKSWADLSDTELIEKNYNQTIRKINVLYSLDQEKEFSENAKISFGHDLEEERDFEFDYLKKDLKI